MECNHDAAPALDSLLFLTGPLPKSGVNPNQRYAYICQKQDLDGPDGKICGRRVWSFPHVMRKSCNECRGAINQRKFEHSEFKMEIDGPPRNTAMSRAIQRSEGPRSAGYDSRTRLNAHGETERRIKWGTKVINQLLAEQNSRCKVCDNLLIAGAFQNDHIIPWADGGPDKPSNWQLLCTAPCHYNKTAKERIARYKRGRDGK